MKVIYGVLYFVALGLLVIGNGSRDVAVAGLFIAASIAMLADVLADIAIGFSKEGITVYHGGVKILTGDIKEEEDDEQGQD